MSGITVPFRKHRYEAFRLNTQLGDVSGDTFTAVVRERPEEDAAEIFEFDIDMTDAATGYIELQFDATLFDIPQSKGWFDIKRVTGGSAVRLHDGHVCLEFEGTTTP